MTQNKEANQDDPEHRKQTKTTQTGRSKKSQRRPLETTSPTHCQDTREISQTKEADNSDQYHRQENSNVKTRKQKIKKYWTARSIDSTKHVTAAPSQTYHQERPSEAEVIHLQKKRTK